MQQLIADAPSLLDHIDDESKQDFNQLCALLDAAGIEYEINQRLVRGLDYYNKTVFEWVTDQLGAQGTVCAGGRFDGLVGQLGGRDTPALGFAMGIERLVALLQDQVKLAVDVAPHAYLVMAGEGTTQAGLALAERLRDVDSRLRIRSNCGGGSFKAQFKRADKSGAQLALILGEEEITRECVTVKDLRHDTEQRSIEWDELGSYLQNHLHLN